MARSSDPNILRRQAVVEQPATERSNRPTDKDENKVEHGNLIARLLNETFDRMYTNKGSLAMGSVTSDPIVEGPINRSKVRDFIKKNALNRQTSAGSASRAGHWRICYLNDGKH